MFYELCAYIGLGVHWKVYSGHCLRILRVRGVPVSAGIRNGIRNSWRCGMAAGAGRAGETALKILAALHSACGVRDRAW